MCLYLLRTMYFQGNFKCLLLFYHYSSQVNWNRLYGPVRSKSLFHARSQLNIYDQYHTYSLLNALFVPLLFVEHGDQPNLIGQHNCWFELRKEETYLFVCS